MSRWVLLVLVAFGFGVVPFVADDYLFSAILIPFLTLSLAGLGLNISTGYAGQLSLGSAAFMAAGAFAAYNFQLRIPGLPVLVSFSILSTGRDGRAAEICREMRLGTIVHSGGGGVHPVRIGRRVDRFGAGRLSVADRQHPLPVLRQ